MILNYICKNFKKEEIKKKTRESKYKLSDFDSHKIEISEELQNVEFNYLEDMLFRREFLYTEILNILDMKCNDASTTQFFLQVFLKLVILLLC